MAVLRKVLTTPPEEMTAEQWQAFVKEQAPRKDAIKSSADPAAIEARVREEVAFTADVSRRAGKRLDSFAAAADAAVALVKEHAPNLAPLAERAAAEGRRADLLSLAAHADDARRDRHVGAQFDALNHLAEQEDLFRAPAPGRGGEDPSPFFVDFGTAQRAP